MIKKILVSIKSLEQGTEVIILCYHVLEYNFSANFKFLILLINTIIHNKLLCPLFGVIQSPISNKINKSKNALCLKSDDVF